MKKSIVYTRTGDLGTTGLVGGERVRKSALRVDTYGTVDELNSWIGVVASSASFDQETREELNWIQNKLFSLGSYLATDPLDEMTQASGFGQNSVSRLERQIDRLDESLPAFRRFVLPGGTMAAAQANVARSVCRRAERRMVALAEESWVDPDTLRFINRLSDFLFVLSRYINVSAGVAEVFWEKDCK
ncbi:MAG: cob(I)yrinic acid a,c-diamide adenosyltransferase [Muribaculaceae bacterium]|nr:cob(I)yrinic acid a,c-diamide adenosyltransferase [Muribaculaceae bacterium]MDE6610245.1 cob(I)yrinic acid a,c-diamide adenosyltransferase [Muribaculaceae bacterium]